LKPIEKIRVHGSSWSAIRIGQQELVKEGFCIKCPILLMCSNRSIRPDKAWRDEYHQGTRIIFKIIIKLCFI
jgi:hypothetical protein